MFPVLRQRNFARLWLGGLVSSFGDWLLALALPFYLYQQTGSAFASGALFMVNILPRVVFGSLAGVFVDHWDRRRTMLVADFARAGLLLLLLPAAVAVGWLWLCYPIVALEATISTFFLPARGALLPHVVSENELLEANSLDTVSDSFIRLLAPAVGGALFGLFGLSSILLIDSGSYLFSGLMIWLVRTPRVAPSLTPAQTAPLASQWVGLWTEWLAGLRHVGGDRVLRAVFLVQCIAGVASGIFSPLLPVFIQKVMQVGPAVLGWMITGTGVGTLLAGLVLGRAGRRWPPIRVGVTGHILLGVALFLTFRSRDTWAVVALSIPAGMGLACGVGFQTLLQAITDDQFRGRVLGALGTTYMLLMLIGEALGSLLADTLGVLPLLYTASSFYVLAGLLGLFVLPAATVGIATAAGQVPDDVGR